MQLPPFLPTAAALSPRAADAEPLDLRGLYSLIWRGAYPAIATNAALDRDLFYGSYLQTYLQRDLRDLARVGDELAFQRFLRGAAARTGQLLNVADLARDADVAPNTARSWLSILEASGLVYLLPPWHGNLGKRLLKTPKLYFLDTGLCAYLTLWSSPETLDAGAMSGAILESWVIAEACDEEFSALGPVRGVERAQARAGQDACFGLGTADAATHDAATTSVRAKSSPLKSSASPHCLASA